jgi:DNA-binding Lrp family transcriptional regulator|tara:strand:- start:454 stop:912 length:459 start_codon:yes stop_codon:yes gene_type:complete
MINLDSKDKSILRELQGNLPIVKYPFREIAGKINITEEELFFRINKLTNDGIIRKFGLRIDSKKVGYASTLIALKVPDQNRDKIAEKLNSYKNITHNYARNHEYNIWATIIANSKDDLEQNIRDIRKNVPHEDLLNLPVIRKFKINVKFDIK